jgi:hypothetical protein
MRICPACTQIIHGKFTSNRTSPQNRYYWGVVISILCEHTGFTNEEMHEVLKYKFLRRESITKDEKHFERSASTAELDTIEFIKYISDIVVWASSELSLQIPEPNEEILP